MIVIGCPYLFSFVDKLPIFEKEHKVIWILFYIFQSYGQSFLQPDLAVFKQNLESLETLNTKWKLYQKVSPWPLTSTEHKPCICIYLTNWYKVLPSSRTRASQNLSKYARDQDFFWSWIFGPRFSQNFTLYVCCTRQIHDHAENDFFL